MTEDKFLELPLVKQLVTADASWLKSHTKAERQAFTDALFDEVTGGGQPQDTIPWLVKIAELNPGVRHTLGSFDLMLQGNFRGKTVCRILRDMRSPESRNALKRLSGTTNVGPTVNVCAWDYLSCLADTEYWEQKKTTATSTAAPAQ